MSPQRRGHIAPIGRCRQRQILQRFWQVRFWATAIKTMRTGQAIVWAVDVWALAPLVLRDTASFGHALKDGPPPGRAAWLPSDVVGRSGRITAPPRPRGRRRSAPCCLRREPGMSRKPLRGPDGLMRHQDRDRQLFQHVAGGSAQKRLAQAGMAVSAHDDRLDPLLSGKAHQDI